MGQGSVVVGLAVIVFGFCFLVLCGSLIRSGFRRMLRAYEAAAWRRDQVAAAKRLTENPEERRRLVDGTALMEAFALTLDEINALPCVEPKRRIA